MADRFFLPMLTGKADLPFAMTNYFFSVNSSSLGGGDNGNASFHQFEAATDDETNASGSGAANCDYGDDLGPVDEELCLRLQAMRRIVTEKNAFRQATEHFGLQFAIVFVAFGVIAVALNILIASILIIHRRKMLEHVFYLLVMNFAIIDILKGTCLILWSVRILKPQANDKVMRIVAMKIDQIALVVLRSCNLATIFNLLMITLNEFIFIIYPLKYHLLINRARAMLLVLVTWLVSVGFTLAGTFARNYVGNVQTVYISSNPRNQSFHASSGVNDDPSGAQNDNGDAHLRRSSDGLELQPQYIFNFILLAFCLFCWIVILICYTIFFRVIRKIQAYDNSLRFGKQSKKKKKDANSGKNRSNPPNQPRPAEASSKPISRSNTRDNSIAFTLDGGTNDCIVGLHQSASNNQLLLLPQQQATSNGLSHRPSTTSTATNCTGSINATSEETANRRIIKKQVLTRNKYVLVIGLVIVVYKLYLLSYGTIQIFQFIRLSQKVTSVQEERNILLIRWALQALVGLHAVFQPLCYFRIKEFRTLVRRTVQKLLLGSNRRASAGMALQSSAYNPGQGRNSTTTLTPRNATTNFIRGLGKKSLSSNAICGLAGKPPLANTPNITTTTTFSGSTDQRNLPDIITTTTQFPRSKTSASFDIVYEELEQDYASNCRSNISQRPTSETLLPSGNAEETKALLTNGFYVPDEDENLQAQSIVMIELYDHHQNHHVPHSRNTTRSQVNSDGELAESRQDNSSRSKPGNSSNTEEHAFLQESPTKSTESAEQESIILNDILASEGTEL